MRLTLIIGPSEASSARLRSLLKQKAAPLLKQGVWAPDWNHVRLYAACAEPDEIGVLRFKRGMDSPLVQKTLTSEFETLIPKELAEVKAKHVVVVAAQLGNLLSQPKELARLKALFDPHFDDIRIVAHIDEQARMLVDHYTYAVIEGRRHDLGAELALAGSKDWWNGALALRGKNEPFFGLFNDIQYPPYWLDYKSMFDLWSDTFGKEMVSFRPLDMAQLCSDQGVDEVSEILGVPQSLGKGDSDTPPVPRPAPWLTRMRQFNDVLIKYMQARDILCPRDTWQQILGAIKVDGPPLEPGSLAAISKHFKTANTGLVKAFPDLKDALTPDAPLEPWVEADPQFGFRATQYLTAFSHRIRADATPISEKRAEAADAKKASAKFDDLLLDDADTKEEKAANTRLLNRVKVNHQMVLSTQFKPHNNLGLVNEEELGAAYAPAPARSLKPGSTGNVIVGCMKNEAPYIIEWIAYHRAIGVDNFLIYTNGCTDGTDEVLGRLQDMGILQHRNNDDWKGNSPQQYALNRALKEPVIQNADWIIHIDVDEFMNVRTGNGTLDDLFAAVPDATNIAMTWRLFGHNGVTQLNDEFVIEQFDTCAPKYCPKPHTVWGFKTMFRNIGAYSKISCHRPNKLEESFEGKVKWVNGSGQDMTRDAAHNGWRSSKKNVGYDLLQLNHYALRSAESFLIKRQRGRALHVDRSIGINYWIRMDWCDFRDITIKRNIPRVRAEYDRLMSDEKLAAFHQQGLAWHREKALELHAMPEFSDLYKQALDVKLNETERVAYALSLDMES